MKSCKLGPLLSTCKAGIGFYCAIYLLWQEASVLWSCSKKWPIYSLCTISKWYWNPCFHWKKTIESNFECHCSVIIATTNIESKAYWNIAIVYFTKCLTFHQESFYMCILWISSFDVGYSFIFLRKIIFRTIPFE